MAKINIAQILGIVTAVQSGVSLIQEKFKGKKTGAEKKQAVIESITELLPAVELAAGKDLIDDAKVQAALSALVDAEKAVLTARAAFAEAVASAKSKAGNEPGTEE